MDTITAIPTLQDAAPTIAPEAVPSPVLATVAFIPHGTGGTAVTLPAEGGRITVDLVITTDGPIAAYQGRPAADTANVFSIDATNWTPSTNILATKDAAAKAASSDSLPSQYDFSVMFWLPVPPEMDAAGQAGELTSNNGSMTVTPDVGLCSMAFDLSAVAGSISEPLGGVFATRAAIGGLTAIPLAPGSTTVATLTLDVVGQPGMYHLSVVDGLIFDADSRQAPLASESLTITVSP